MPPRETAKQATTALQVPRLQHHLESLPTHTPLSFPVVLAPSVTTALQGRDCRSNVQLAHSIHSPAKLIALAAQRGSIKSMPARPHAANLVRMASTASSAPTWPGPMKVLLASEKRASKATTARMDS